MDKIIFKSPTVARLWSKYQAYFWVGALISFTLFATIQSSDAHRDYIYAQGTYHKSTMFRCDFGVINGWGTEYLDIEGNKIPCKIVSMRPSEIRKLFNEPY